MSSSSRPLPRPGIDQIKAYVPGQTVEGQGRSIKLSANESALGPSPKAIAAYHDAASRMDRYPDADAFGIRSAIAKRYGLNAARILMGIGSDELLSALVRAYAGAGDEVLYPTATFPMYRIYTLATGAQNVQAADLNYGADIEALLAKVTPRTKVVIIANPNNPTGTYTTKQDLERLRAGLREDILLIIDAAYAEYVEHKDYDSGAALVDATNNTVMTRTFSKIHGMAGMRLGWCYAYEDIIGVVGRIRSPFNVSTPAQAAGIAALADLEFQQRVIDHTRRWRQILAQRLKGYGLSITGSEGNFVNAGFPDAPGRKASDLDGFLRARGISVRPMAMFGLPQHLRITIGKDDEMQTLMEALDAFYTQTPSAA
ncbi:MAG: histidinol-phosphate transaminase [Rhodospirillaceae bacterium]|nr:histidinol-phosphate transaminase [Rhodospirillaceae bacterium]